MRRSNLVSPDWPIRRFLNRLASSDPAPGGGSAAALAGALGCALGAMVARILLSRSGIRSAEKAKLRLALRKIERAGSRLSALIRRDALAYKQLVAAQQRRGGSLLRARKAAIDCPMEICRQSMAGRWLLRGLLKKTGPYLGSDVRAGLALLRGAFDSGMEMVLINLRGGGLGAAGRKLQSELAKLERNAERLHGNA